MAGANLPLETASIGGFRACFTFAHHHALFTIIIHIIGRIDEYRYKLNNGYTYRLRMRSLAMLFALQLRSRQHIQESNL